MQGNVKQKHNDNVGVKNITIHKRQFELLLHNYVKCLKNVTEIMLLL